MLTTLIFMIKPRRTLISELKNITQQEYTLNTFEGDTKTTSQASMDIETEQTDILSIDFDNKARGPRT